MAVELVSDSLTGATVIVTGGASGLGLAVIRHLARIEARPVVFDTALPPEPYSGLVVDVCNGAAVEQAVADVQATYGRLDAVVTCAGIDRPGRLDEVTRPDWERVVAVNLFGTASVVRAALPELRRRRGRVVTVASTLGHRALSDATAYCASKFAVVGFTRALVAEVGDEVGVTMVTPGGMSTAFFDDREARYKPPPGAVLADPEEVAEAIVFALTRRHGTQVRELVVTAPAESSWP